MWKVTPKRKSWSLLNFHVYAWPFIDEGRLYERKQAAAYSGPWLNKPRTPRINGTKSTFTAYSTHGYFKPRLILAEEFWVGLIQAAAYLGRESVRINGSKTLSAACWSRERLLRMLCFQLYPRPSRLRDARCSGGKVTCCTRKLKILSKQHLIHMHPWNISFKPLDWSLTNFSSRFPTSFATAQR